VNGSVRRLQVRIVKAVEAGRWGKVKALQRLLTSSRSGKLLAVRRVTENAGRKASGVDGEGWNTPEKKMAAVDWSFIRVPSATFLRGCDRKLLQDSRS
jgi:RNA-directed DNA polymerase